MYTQLHSLVENGPLAQLVEQFPFKEWVVGSSPTGLTIKYYYTCSIGGYFIVTSFSHSLSHDKN